MNYWLVKSEPEAYSFDQLKADKKTEWTGVRNFAARLHLRAMKKGDTVLYYHSGEGKEIVGIAKVTRAAQPDPTATEGDWSSVEIEYMKKINPVTLLTIKKDASLKSFPLVRIGRLSVMPVNEKEYERVLFHSEK
jgi:predicted RNA-binding protein with PUA-like domain